MYLEFIVFVVFGYFKFGKIESGVVWFLVWGWDGVVGFEVGGVDEEI